MPVDLNKDRHWKNWGPATPHLARGKSELTDLRTDVQEALDKIGQELFDDLFSAGGMGTQLMDQVSLVNERVVQLSAQISAIASLNMGPEADMPSSQLAQQSMLAFCLDASTELRALQKQLAHATMLSGDQAADLDGKISYALNQISSLGATFQHSLALLDGKIGGCGTVSDQTADATPSVTTIYTPQDGEVVTLEVEVLAAQTDNSEVASYKLWALAKRAGATTTIVSGPTPIPEKGHEDDANWDATIIADGANLQLQVTGVAATDIDWSCRFKASPLAR